MDFPDAGGEGTVTITPFHMSWSIGSYLAAATSPITSASAVWPSASLALFVPFIAPCTLTVVKMFTINGATAAGNQDVGIYDMAGHRLVSIGATAQAGTTAIQTHDITDTTLQPGRYYMAMSNNNGTSTYWSLAQTFKQQAGGAGILQMAAAEPLPDPATFAAAGFGYVPWFGLTARTLI